MKLRFKVGPRSLVNKFVSITETFVSEDEKYVVGTKEYNDGSRIICLRPINDNLSDFACLYRLGDNKIDKLTIAALNAIDWDIPVGLIYPKI